MRFQYTIRKNDPVTEQRDRELEDYLAARDAVLTQHGATPLALDGSGRGTITFPVPFAGAPTIVVSVTLSTGTTMTAHVVSKSATDFTVQVDSDSSPEASVTRQVNWIAMGEAAP